MSQPPFSKLVGRASGVGSLSQQLGMGARSGSSGRSIKRVRLTGSGNWVAPADAVGTFVAYLWGPGSNGAAGSTSGPVAGGSSGALAIVSSQILAAGKSYPYTVGSPGTDTTMFGATAGKATDASGNTPGAVGVAANGDININGSLGGTGVSFAPGSSGHANNGANGANSSNGGRGAWAFAHSTSAVAADAGGGGAGAPSPPEGAPLGGRGGQGAGVAVLSGAGSFDSGEDGMFPGGGSGAGSARDTISAGSAGVAANGSILIEYLSNIP